MRDRAEHPVLFYAMAYAFRQGGNGEKVIRVPALIFGVLSIPLLVTLGWRLFGPRAGLLAAALLTFSVYHIDFSQDARSYTLLLFWSLVAWHGVAGCVLAGQRWWMDRQFPWWLCGGSAGLLAVGVVRACRSLERSAILLPWALMPFLVFGFVPFGKFFDLRFLITALPPFLLLVGAGLDWIIEGISRVLARLARFGDRRVPARLVEALCAILLLWSAAGPYRTFRRLEQRCSDFYHRSGVMRQERGSVASTWC